MKSLIAAERALYIGLAALVCANGWARADRPGDVAAQVEAYMDPLVESGLFMGSILIARDGAVVLSQGYGLANLEHGVPNTSSSRFNIASVNKTFTAMAVLMLQERGQLHVKEHLGSYLPDCPDGWREITLHHLLTHTSGIPNYTELPDYYERKSLAAYLTEALERIRHMPLAFPPGEQFAYSNTGYVLLHSIIEKVSGQSYQDFLERHILTPLDMSNTGFFTRPGIRHAVVTHRAAGYTDGQGPLENAPWAHYSNAGDMYSTVEDLYRWDQALYTERLVSADTLKTAFTPFKGNYGYGWFVYEREHQRLMLHGGGTPGYALLFARYPDQKVTIIIASNLDSSPTSRIHDDLAAIVFGRQYQQPKLWKEVSINPAIYEAYVGRYQNIDQPRFIITVTKEHNQLWNRLGDDPGATTMLLRPLSETHFFNKTLVLYEVTFHANAAGQVTELVADGPWGTGRFKRIE